MTLDRKVLGLDRRMFLRGTAGAGAAVALQALMARGAAAQPGPGFDPLGPKPKPAPNNGGYGPLEPAPGGELWLPAGFSYVAFGRTGTPMSDGIPTPGRHDGMATFDTGGGMVRLVRNHEQDEGAAFASPAYDPAAAGGTTNLVFDTNKMELVRSNASLAGTIRNCAGGPHPNGSWLSCEETYTEPGGAIRHGYIFEVPAGAEGPVEPVPLTAMGQFTHEAVAVDPRTGIVYETEDQGTSGFYRFVPTNRRRLAAGGQLQMLAVRGRPQYDTRTGQRLEIPLPVEWVDIDDPDPDTGGELAVFDQGRAKGGAVFSRLEGAWWGDGSAYIVSTDGGNAQLGQVWEYRPLAGRFGLLKLIYESVDATLLESPDNITVSPRTNGMVLCEDGDGIDLLRGLTRDGKIFDFCRLNSDNDSELAGATFTRNGQVLFFNVQDPGITYAVTGPWRRGAL